RCSNEPEFSHPGPFPLDGMSRRHRQTWWSPGSQATGSQKTAVVRSREACSVECAEQYVTSSDRCRLEYRHGGWQGTNSISASRVPVWKESLRSEDASGPGGKLIVLQPLSGVAARTRICGAFLE